MRQNIVILGATGKVGRELVKQVAACDVPELQMHENPTVVVGLVDSTHAAIEPGGFPQRELALFARTRQRVNSIIEALKLPNDGIAVLPGHMQRLGFNEDIVYVDATALREPAKDLHLRIIRATRSKIATANKNPIGLYDCEVYRELTADPRRYQYSAITMAGLGAVPWLSQRHTIQDKVHRIDASLSGTMGFITNALMEERKLSEAIRDARERGYTEPDYRDDLNGVDVARKLTILAREAGFEIDFKNIEIEPFLPREFLEMSDSEECLQRIERELDNVMAVRYAEAAQRRMTLKYLASFAIVERKPVLKVGLVEVPQESAFGRLRGTDNRIEVVTDMYHADRSFKLEGPGAGLDLTASVLRRDLLHLQERVQRF